MIPTINFQHLDKAVETEELWPALNFRSHRELLSEIEKSVRQESKKLFTIITSEYHLRYNEGKGKGPNSPKHWGVAYLLGRQNPTRPILSVYPSVDEMYHVFSFFDHAEEILDKKGRHCGSMDFRDTYALCERQMAKDYDGYEESNDMKTFSQVEYSPSYYEKARRDKKNKEKTFFEVEYSPTYHKKGAEQI